MKKTFFMRIAQQLARQGSVVKPVSQVYSKAQKQQAFQAVQEPAANDDQEPSLAEQLK
jgi:hypothetical protein